MNLTKEQSDSLYVAKAFAILSVVCAHMTFVDGHFVANTVRDCLGQIGVGIFLFISGFFYKRRENDTKEFWGKKIKSTIIPWLLMSTCVYMMSVFVFKAVDLSVVYFIKNFLGIGTHYWYMSVSIILYVIFKFINKDWQLIMCVLLTVISVLLSAFLVDEYSFQINQYFNLFNWIGFFALGILFRKSNLLEKFQKNLFVPIFLALCIVFIVVELKIDAPLKSYIGYTSLFVEISGLLFVICISKMLSANKILIDIGKKSFFIYLMHIQIVGVINARLPNNTLFFVLRPIIGLGLCYVLVVIFEKFLKILKMDRYSFLFGLNR